MSEHSFDAIVIGGGPVGGLAAGLIAKAGYRVAIVEEHERIGEPVQCAGLITPRCFDIVDYARGTILNKLKAAEIYSPAGQPLIIGKDKIQAVVIDRTAFDRSIIEKTMDSGAALISGERVRGLDGHDKRQVTLGNRTLEAKIIIGADGAKSVTRKLLGLDEPTYLLNGFSADVSGLEIDQQRAKVFFGRNLAPNFFAWMIPAGDITRVGLCTRGGNGTVHEHFKRLFKAGETANILSGGKVVKSYSGIIPIGTLDRTSADGGMIVGDAACQVKATSGGGIYPGLVCARHCANMAIKALEKDDFSGKMLSGYHDAWTSDIGDELKKAMMMHRIYASLDDKQLEEIFRMLSNKEIIETINSVGDIDYPSRLGWVLLKKEPGFLKYAGKFLRYGLLNS
jgi:digeranylgeranylglycerophospholipid reductase